MSPSPHDTLPPDDVVALHHAAVVLAVVVGSLVLWASWPRRRPDRR